MSLKPNIFATWRLLSFIIPVTLALSACNFADLKGEYYEISRTYSPDSSKYILKCNYAQGAWDGGRTYFAKIVDVDDSLAQEGFLSLSSLDFDEIYWSGNDTLVVEENYLDYISNGKSKLANASCKNLFVKVVQKDFLESTAKKIITYREVSPNKENELIVYRYRDPRNGDYFLNISVIGINDSIPKYGNFYVSKFNFDCFTDIKWNEENGLDIKASEDCYYAFDDYLVKTRPKVKYNVKIEEGVSVAGNVRYAH